MATTIVTKYGSDAPAASDIVRGELAVDTENGRLYTENSSGAVVEIGLNPEGAATFGGEVLIPEKLGHVGDTDTHFKFAGANDIRIVAGDVEHAAFDGTIVFNQSGSSSMDFRVESDTQDHMLFVDASLNRIGIANNAPATALDVTGTVTADGANIKGGNELRVYRTDNATYGSMEYLTGAGGLKFRDVNGDGMTFAGATSDYMRISGGNVGIGVTPASGVRLDVRSNAAATLGDFRNASATGFGLYVAAGDTSSQYAFRAADYQNNALFSVMGDGNVGIGIAPQSFTNLMVNTATDRNISIFDNAAGATICGLTDAGASAALRLAGSPLIFTGNGGSGAEHMRIDSDGRALYGTTDTTLYNNTSGNGALINGAGGEMQIACNNGAPMWLNRMGSDGEIIKLYKAGTAVGSIGTANADSITIGNSTGNLILYAATVAPSSNSSGGSSDGVVSLGTTARRFKDLYLSGGVRGTSTLDITIPETAGGAIQLEFGNNTNNARRTVRAYKDNFEPVDADDGVISLGQAANRWKDLFLSNNLLLGTTTPSTKLTVQGTSTGDVVTVLSGATSNTNVGMIVFRDGGADFCGQITTNGSTNTTAYNTSSDQRLKENIADADDAGSKIDAIQVRKFDWIKSGLHQDYGMVAQELQTVAPEAVAAPEDPEDMMGVDYSKLVPMLVKEIQSLRARVAQLES